MKNVATIVACFAVVMLSSCGKDDDEKVAVTGVTLNQTTVSLEIGGTFQLTATVAPADAANKGVAWTSSNPGVAGVNNTGLVTATGTGTATITVTTTDGGKAATCNVTVADGLVAVTGVTLNETTVSLEVGGTIQLTATVTPADATNKEVTWASSNTNIAGVNNAGLVTATGAGTATITVTTTDGGKVATCTVTVEEPIQDIEKHNWKKHDASSEWGTRLVTCAFDDDYDTYWHSVPFETGLPEWFSVDMQKELKITGFTFVNRQDRDETANPKAMKLEVSSNGSSWQTVLTINEVPQIYELQEFQLNSPVMARYFKVTVESDWSDWNFTYIAEIGIY